MLLKWTAKNFDLSIVRARSLVRATTFHFLFVAGVTATKSATNALYLARRDPHDLPYLYLATALVVTAITVAIARKLASTSAKPVLRLALIVAAALLFALATLAALDVRSALGALYVVGEAYATAITVLFWARLGEVFDVRAAKRVFGAISAAGMIGAILGGVLVHTLASVVPSVAWCFVAGASLLLCRPLLGAERTPGSVRRDRVPMREGLRYAATDRFPLAIAGLVLLFSVQTAAIDFAFRTGSHRVLQADEAKMAALFGVLNALAGALSIAFQAFLSRWFLRRLGVFSYLSLVPATCVALVAWSLFSADAFLALFFLKVVEMMGSFSINQAGIQLLYNPMPPAVRGSVRAMIDGAVKKSGAALGGLALLILAAWIGPRGILVFVIVLALLLLLSVRVLRPLYLNALEKKLGGKGSTPIPVIDVSDRATRQQLKKALRDGDEKKALAAISVLSAESWFDFRPVIATVMSHPSLHVRMKAIELIERAPDPAYAPFLASVVEAPGSHPKASAARALMLVDPERARRVLAPVLLATDGQSDRSLLAAALVAILSETSSSIEDVSTKRAEAVLRDRLSRATTTEERRELAWVLGMLGPGRFAPYLVTFLEDSNRLVRAVALESAAKAKDASHVGVLLDALGERSHLRLVRAALAAHQNTVVAALEHLLVDRAAVLSARAQVPLILREIGSDEAAAALLRASDLDEAYLRLRCIEELSRIRRRDPRVAFPVEPIESRVLDRLRAYTYYRPIAQDLSDGHSDFQLLSRAVHDRVRQNLESALGLLGLILDPATIDNALRGLKKGERHARSDACEVLDLALSKSAIRDEVLLHLEPGPPGGVGGRCAARADEIIDSDEDSTLVLIARETLARRTPSVGTLRPVDKDAAMSKAILDKVFLMQNVQLFRGLAVDDLRFLAAITKDGHAEPRELIYKEGEFGDSMYIIISGEIHLLRDGRPLLDLHAGDSFGQTSILDGGSRPVTAKAGDDGVEFMQLERQPLMDLMADRPELMKGLFVELASRIRELIKLSHVEGEERPAEAGMRAALVRPASHLEPTG